MRKHVQAIHSRCAEGVKTAEKELIVKYLNQFSDERAGFREILANCKDAGSDSVLVTGHVKGTEITLKILDHGMGCSYERLVNVVFKKFSVSKTGDTTIGRFNIGLIAIGKFSGQTQFEFLTNDGRETSLAKTGVIKDSAPIDFFRNPKNSLKKQGTLVTLKYQVKGTVEDEAKVLYEIAKLYFGHTPGFKVFFHLGKFKKEVFGQWNQVAFGKSEKMLVKGRNFDILIEHSTTSRLNLYGQKIFLQMLPMDKNEAYKVFKQLPVTLHVDSNFEVPFSRDGILSSEKKVLELLIQKVIPKIYDFLGFLYEKYSFYDSFLTDLTLHMLPVMPVNKYPWTKYPVFNVIKDKTDVQLSYTDIEKELTHNQVFLEPDEEGFDYSVFPFIIIKKEQKTSSSHQVLAKLFPNSFSKLDSDDLVILDTTQEIPTKLKNITTRLGFNEKRIQNLAFDQRYKSNFDISDLPFGKTEFSMSGHLSSDFVNTAPGRATLSQMEELVGSVTSLGFGFSYFVTSDMNPVLNKRYKYFKNENKIVLNLHNNDIQQIVSGKENMINYWILQLVLLENSGILDHISFEVKSLLIDLNIQIELNQTNNPDTTDIINIYRNQINNRLN